MADYYTQFSEQLVLKGGKKAVAWAEEYLGQFHDEMVEEGDPKRKEQEALAELYGLEHDYFYLAFEWDIRSSKGEKSTVWIRSEVTGNPDHVANFVQAYLNKFDPTGSFGISWSSTCSKMRTDGFGGGCAFITANNIEWMDTAGWLHKKQQAFEKKKAKTSEKKAS